MSKEDYDTKEVDWNYEKFKNDACAAYIDFANRRIVREGEIAFENIEKYKDMEKKEPKRDEKGRFVKKSTTEVKFEVEPKPKSKKPKMVSISADELKQIKLERDAFRETAEGVSSMYLNKCKELRDANLELKAYRKNWKRLRGLADTWKKRALDEQEKHLFAMDAVRMACMHIWWLRRKLSWFRLWKYRKKLADMDIELDRYIERVEGLDKE